jgi:hypothetical protein
MNQTAVQKPSSKPIMFENIICVRDPNDESDFIANIIRKSQKNPWKITFTFSIPTVIMFGNEIETKLKKITSTRKSLGPFEKVKSEDTVCYSFFLKSEVSFIDAKGKAIIFFKYICDLYFSLFTI